MAKHNLLFATLALFAAQVAQGESLAKAQAGVLARINGGETAPYYNTFFSINPVHNNTTYAGYYAEQARSYDVLEAASNACSNVNGRHVLGLIKSYDCYNSSWCLMFQGNTDVPGCSDSDRGELRLSPQQATPTEFMHFDEWRYLRFSIRVSSYTTPPANRAIVSQTWQHGSTYSVAKGAAVGPGFFIALTDCRDDAAPCGANQIGVDFVYRGNVTAPNEGATTFLHNRINYDTWYTYYVQMKPRYVNYPVAGRGVILVWRNNSSFILEQALNYDTNETCAAPGAGDPCHKFYWGYPPEVGGLQNGFDIRLGFYRPTPLTDMMVYMDNVKLTSNASELSTP